MKTAEQTAKEFAEKSGLNYTKPNNFLPHNWVVEAIKEYAREAIKADRANVAKHAKSKSEGNSSWVDKDSIINAPQVELK